MTQTHFRWMILSFLFVATTIVYIDRSALGILAPELQKTIGWNEEQYGKINSAFMAAYAICFILMGQVIDRIGTKKGYILSVGIWTFAAISHAFARTWIGFAGSRFGLAIGQSGNFPSALKSVAEWFPKKERALAISIFNGGSNVGTILAPLIIPFVVLTYGSWQLAFLITPPIGLVWLLLWMKYYSPPASQAKVSASELAYINSDETEQSTNISWKQIIPHRETWAIAIGKFVGDPIWWFYLFWGAKFLYAKFGLDLKSIGLPFFSIYLVSWLIAIGLGWLSSRFFAMGFGINKGRKLGMLLCAMLALPVMLVPHIDNMWLAVTLLALAAGGHCGWSANVFSLMSDIFPKAASASVAGFGGFAGAVGGFIATFGVGKILQSTGTDGYSTPFLVAGAGYITALLVIHILVPKIRPLEL